jgi:hypothetical protein
LAGDDGEEPECAPFGEEFSSFGMSKMSGREEGVNVNATSYHRRTGDGGSDHAGGGERTAIAILLALLLAQEAPAWTAHAILGVLVPRVVQPLLLHSTAAA